MIQDQTYPPFINSARRLRSAFWRRRIIVWLVRATWIALLVPTVVMAGYLWLDWQVSWLIWVPLMFLVGALFFLWSLRPIDVKQLTRRIDDKLAMQAQLVTAYEVSDPSTTAVPTEENPVVDQLIENTVNMAIDLRQQIRFFDRGFWIEMRTLIAIAAILGAMLIFDALSTDIPNAPPVDLPPAGQEPPANAVVPPPPAPQSPPPSMTPEEILSALQILADALRDQAITRPISEAIDRGDLGTAAAEVRRLADQLDALSEDARREFGDNMQEAADKIDNGFPALTAPLEKGNQALDAGDLGQANEALEELAEVLDNLDDQPPDPPSSPPEEPEKQNQSEPEEEERLPIDAQDLELEIEPDQQEQILQPSELNSQNNEESDLEPPFSKQPLNLSDDDLGPDPLTYPWEKRDIIRQYFTPSGE